MKKYLSIIGILLSAIMLWGCTANENDLDIELIEMGHYPNSDLVKIGNTYFYPLLSKCFIFLGIFVGIITMIYLLLYPKRHAATLSGLLRAMNYFQNQGDDISAWKLQKGYEAELKDKSDTIIAGLVWIPFMIGSLQLCQAFGWFIIWGAATIMVLTFYLSNHKFNLVSVGLYLLVLVIILLVLNGGHVYESYKP